MRFTIYKAINTMLSGFLMALGFTSCSNDGPYMYGTPYGEYQINGRVKSRAGAPVENAAVIVRGGYQTQQGVSYDNPYDTDTVFTDSRGEYKLTKKTDIVNKVRVVCVKEGFEPDSTEVGLTYKGGDGDWNIGTAKATVDFNLTKDKE